ncbi:MAG: hypothetical protein R3F20_03935 [Planctomycetota bacterium]
MRLVLCAVLCAMLGDTLAAQNPAFPVSRFQELIASFPGAVDDVVVLPTGQRIVSRTDINAVGYVSTGAVTGFTFINTAPILSLSLEYGPDGKLYSGDAFTGEVVRFDLTTNQRSAVSGGFNVPIDIAFDAAGDMWVVDQTDNDFNFGVNTLWKIDLDANGAETSRTFITNFSGAADVAFGNNGKAYASSLGSIDLLEFDFSTGAVNVPVGGLFLPSDILAIGPGLLAVTCIYQAQVLIIEAATGLVTPLALNLGGNTSGAEDLALDADGNLVVSMSTGQLYRIDITSALRQTTPAKLGTWAQYELDAPAHAGENFALALSVTANVGIPIPGGSEVVPLDPDSLFAYSTTTPRPAELAYFDGVLDAAGRAPTQSWIPPIPSLVGFELYVSGVLYGGPTAPPATWTALNAAKLKIVP